MRVKADERIRLAEVSSVAEVCFMLPGKGICAKLVQTVAVHSMSFKHCINEASHDLVLIKLLLKSGSQLNPCSFSAWPFPLVSIRFPLCFCKQSWVDKRGSVRRWEENA